MKRLISIFAAVSVSVLALIYALWYADLSELILLLSSGNYLAIVPFLAILLLYLLFTALRWRIILIPLGEYSLTDITPAMMIGIGGNNVLPAHLGELARTVVFAKRFGLSKSGILSTQVLERILDVFAILFFYFASVVLITPFPDSIRLGSNLLAVVVGFICAGIFAFLWFPTAIARLWKNWMAWLPKRLFELGSRILEDAAAGLYSLKSPSLVLLLLAYTIAKWLAAGAMVWISLWMYGESIPLTICMIVLAVVALAITVPSAPGYFGTMQAAFVFALTPFAIPSETALAASLFYQIAQWIPVTITGVCFFIFSGSRINEMDAEMSQLRRSQIS